MLVLVGADDSPSALAALRWGHRLAAATHGHLCVTRAWAYGRLSALPGSGSLPDAAEMDARADEETRDLVAETIGTETETETSIVRGPVRHALLAEVQRRQPSVVVIGRRGLGPIDSRLLGSTSRRLVESAPCPVVLMADGARLVESTSPTVLVGVDGSSESMLALEWAKDVVAPLGGELVVVRVAGPAGRNVAGRAVSSDGDQMDPVLDHASTSLEGAGVRYRLVLAWGDPRTALVDAAEQEGADLVVVGTRGLGGMSKLMLGSVASYLAQCCELPVAVVPPSDRAS